ncbi:hypothetical protein GCM10007938_10020 [Vibrio zhanjiangensis]|uniref:Uncharacterized protein n=1 Tax=Vibrio zhanjiangensis TaxID=1046128 RepID=A0ABQ6EXH4_9VIBR|nr:hypothetical protein GCM10007938_10020 [Vibrio zhanjiangensis]
MITETGWIDKITSINRVAYPEFCTWQTFHNYHLFNQWKYTTLISQFLGGDKADSSFEHFIFTLEVDFDYNQSEI